MNPPRIATGLRAAWRDRYGLGGLLIASMMAGVSLVILGLIVVG